MQSSRVGRTITTRVLPWTTINSTDRAKAEECRQHAQSSADLAIKLGFVTLALEWHELAKHRSRYLNSGACNRRATADGDVVTRQ
jgi:hypothetical protein